MKRIIKVLITSFISILFVACGKAPRIEEGNTFNLSGDAQSFTIHTNLFIRGMETLDYKYDENGSWVLVLPCSSRSYEECTGEWYIVTRNANRKSITISVGENTTGQIRKFNVEFGCGRHDCFVDITQAAK